jgi:hypothetical protein
MIFRIRNSPIQTRGSGLVIGGCEGTLGIPLMANLLYYRYRPVALMLVYPPLRQGGYLRSRLARTQLSQRKRQALSAKYLAKLEIYSCS